MFSFQPVSGQMKGPTTPASTSEKIYSDQIHNNLDDVVDDDSEEEEEEEEDEDEDEEYEPEEGEEGNARNLYLRIVILYIYTQSSFFFPPLIPR